MHLWSNGLNYLELAILSGVVLILILIFIVLVTKLWTKINKPITSTERISSYCKSALTHRKKGTIVLLLLFISAGFVLSWLNDGENTFAAYNSNLIQGSHQTNQYGVELSTGYRSEVWTSGEDIFVYGTFSVNDTSGNIVLIEFGSINRSLETGLTWISTTYFESGLYYLEAYTNSSGHLNLVAQIPIYVSKLSLGVSQIVSYFYHLTTFLIITEALFFPITYIIIILPARKVIDEIPKFSSDFSIPEDFNLEKDLLERTYQTIQYLSSRTDYYYSKRSTLLTTAGVLLAACTGLPTIMITLSFDSQLLNTIFYFVLWSVIFIAGGIFYLHKSTTSDFMPSSSWFYRKRISDESSSEKEFDLDLTRNFYSFIESEKKDYLRENVSEIVTLYYILRNASYNYDSSFAFIAIGAVNLFMGLFFVFALVLELDAILLIAIVILLGLLLYIPFHYVKIWLDEEISSEILTIYCCFKSLKDDDPMHVDFRDIIVNHFSSSFGIIDTCQYSDDERKALFDSLTEQTKEFRKSSNWKFVDFSTDSSQYTKIAKEIPILVVKKIGEKKSVIVYPYIDVNGKTHEISDFLTKSSEL